MSEQDIMDAVQNGVIEAKEKAGEAGQNGKVQRRKTTNGFPFKVDEDGISKRIQRDNDDGSTRTQWIRFGTELHVLALTRNNEGEEWGRLLEIVDRDGTRHRWAMPATLLAGSGDQLRSELFSLGFELEPNRDAKGWLLQYLISSDPAPRARCVSKIGWHGKTFAMPDGPVEAKGGGEQIILQSTERLDHAFNMAGSLNDWKISVAGPAQGNSRLVLAISTAFAAPLLAVSGDQGGGFHIVGSSSTGKTTALNVAGSVWGGGDGLTRYVKSWRATDDALESVAAMSCDVVLCLDELSEADAKAVGASVYMLANGKGKARAGREGQARKVLEWRTLFLSSGEMGLADKIKEGGGKIAAGMEVRVIDVRADTGAGMGLFDDIHGAADPATFAQSLNRASSTTYGTAGRAFVAEVVKDFDKYRDNLSGLRRAFVQQVVPVGADGQVRRVADRFSLVAAAGEIATALDLTGWSAGTARDAAQCCFEGWLRDRGGHGSGEVAAAKRRISEALQMHGSSRFQRWVKSSSDRMVIVNRLGFVKIEGDVDIENVEGTYYFMPAPLKDLLAGMDFRTVIAELMALGVIVSHNGKPNKVFHVSSGGGKQRLYQIDATKLDETAGQDDVQCG